VERRCSCGGEIDADGWCTVCGLRAANERDHFTEQPAPHVAAVSDRGLVHSRNEDAVALAASDDRTVLVVCDGVTTATDSDVASLAAARAARDVLAAAPSAPTSSSPTDRTEYWTARLVEAAAAAQAAASASAACVAAVENPPSTTFVATVADRTTVITGCVGDSRAYWFGDDGTARQLSADDSWASAEIAHGVTRAVAEADPRAHAITRWLGADSPDSTPSFAAITAPGSGWLLACSDGLWNYCSEPTDLAALLARCAAPAGDDPLKLAESLVDWANTQGGHDNITAALARIEPCSATDEADPGLSTPAPVKPPQPAGNPTDPTTSTAPRSI
jgi:serine/threonine protein phosphatase PrpC